MKILLGALVLLAPACHGQLANSPGAVKAFALNAGVDTRYSLTNSVTEVAPRFGVDYRLNNVLRLGLNYSHSFFAVQPSSLLIRMGPVQANSVSISLNVKLLQWGKVQ